MEALARSSSRSEVLALVCIVRESSSSSSSSSPRDSLELSFAGSADNAGDFGWAEKYTGDWARVGALRILPISEQ